MIEEGDSQLCGVKRGLLAQTFGEHLEVKGRVPLAGVSVAQSPDTENHRHSGVPVLRCRPLWWRAAWLVIGTPLPILLHSPAPMSMENNILSPQYTACKDAVLLLGSFSPLLSTR